ncbi:MAG TPA: nuclear transport factor 2 family protein [bacterium]|nr:nuclear transport factor 2 family protein [bacterium]
MRHHIAGVLAASIIATNLCPPVSAQTRTSGANRQALLSLEHDWLTAHDSATLDRILAPDFIHPIGTGDFLTKAAHIHWFAGHPPPAGIRYRFDRLDVRLYGDVGIVNGTVVAEDDRGAELDRTVFTDVFAYRQGRWQAVNGQENRVGPPPTRPTPAVTGRDSVIASEVTESLRDYYRGFELEDSSRLAAGVTQDFDSYFSIPGHSSALDRFDAAGVASGFAAAVRQYHGHAPRMELSDVLVLARSDITAVAAYRMLFYLDGALRNDALAVSELRRDHGAWRLARHFEVKRH